MNKGVRCAHCGNIVKEICADCWKCIKCCECENKGRRMVDGRVHEGKKQSKK